jgi:hypothetical protein
MFAVPLHRPDGYPELFRRFVHCHQFILHGDLSVKGEDSVLPEKYIKARANANGFHFPRLTGG